MVTVFPIRFFSWKKSLCANCILIHKSPRNDCNARFGKRNASKVESNECYWGWVKTIASKEESNDCDARFGKKNASKVE